MKPTREDIELYVMGAYDGDTRALERAIEQDAAARAMLAEEAGLEHVLREAGGAARFCPGCRDLVTAERCEACGAAVRPGGYLVERVLVSNAHGRMYVARDADGKRVALKELAFVQAPTLAMVAAFEREAKFLRALEHPAIPRFLASFEEGRGVHVRYYLAQELVVGESLEARLEEHWYTEAEIANIARQVLGVLEYLQGLSPMVIHRDIKPANLLVRSDGSISVVDFGAAHVQGTTAGSTTIGTFGYMPVEQLAGIVDATTDVYALGASLLHLMMRREPWRVLQDRTFVGLNASKPMRAFLARLVASDPRERFPNAAAARAELDRITSTPEPKRRTRWLGPAVIAATASMFAASIGSYALFASDDDDDEEVVVQRRGIVHEIARLHELVERACACKDLACALAVLDASSTSMAQVPDKPTADQPTADQAWRMGVLSQQLNTCVDELKRREPDPSGRATEDPSPRAGASGPGDPAPRAGASAPRGTLDPTRPRAGSPTPADAPRTAPGTAPRTAPGTAPRATLADAPRGTPALAGSTPDLDGLRQRADALYRSRRFHDAARELRMVADARPASEAGELRTAAAAYEQVGRAYAIGMGPATKPSQAYTSLKTALSLDASLGGALTADMTIRLASVAPRAAIAFYVQKEYAAAYRAVRTAEQLGSNSLDVKTVRRQLESVAAELYLLAERDAAEHPDAAKAKLVQLKDIVDPTHALALKAKALLGRL